jgi:hypothetical protein
MEGVVKVDAKIATLVSDDVILDEKKEKEREKTKTSG